MNTTITRAIIAAAAAGAFALPLAASAAIPGETQLHGTITAFNGKYDLHVQERNGEVDDVRLHPGTIINPTGLTLQPGMRVTIVGDQQGATLTANEIDTPYQIVYAPPVDPFYGGWGWGGGPYWGARFHGWF